MLLSVPRSTYYYKPKPENAENLEVMRYIDMYSLEHPTTGVKKMTSALKAAGYVVNEKRVRRLSRLLGYFPIMPRKKNVTKNDLNYVHPYLLKDLEVSQPNQVWSTDISYIPMPHGFMYLYAIIDVYSRFVLGWRLSNTLDDSNCHELMKECVERYGAPQIVNTDQGSQYTTKKWADLLRSYGIRISMDGKGRCKDNIWIERFWRTIKQEYIYINPTDDVSALRAGIGDFVEHYNVSRPHQTLGYNKPIEWYTKAA